MNGNEAAQRREAIIMHPYTGMTKSYYGDQVYSVTETGIVIAVSQSRLFYPWSRVTMFSYHNDDVSARKIIQGY